MMGPMELIVIAGIVCLVCGLPIVLGVIVVVGLLITQKKK